jgi:FAD/FMN-containing dehydrogenase
VAGLGGSISAEHGVGRAKRSWLHLSRGPAEIAAMRALKAALDPTGMLNPGVLLPPTSTVGPMGVPAGNLRAP